MLSNDLRQRAALIRPIPKMTFHEQLERAAGLVETRLDALLGNGGGAPVAKSGTLAEAMRYAVLGGGKRLRPFLLIAVGKPVRRSRAGFPGRSLRARMRALLLAGP